jgi:hypothetical protein
MERGRGRTGIAGEERREKGQLWVYAWAMIIIPHFGSDASLRSNHPDSESSIIGQLVNTSWKNHRLFMYLLFYNEETLHVNNSSHSNLKPFTVVLCRLTISK